MKAVLAALILKFLGLGVLLLQRKDARMQDELKTYPVGSAVQIRAWDGGPVLCLGNGIAGWSATAVAVPTGPGVVEVVFKSPAAAVKALLGLQSVAGAFLENRVIVRGDLMVTLPLVRAVNLVEAHLFPGWWTKPIGPLPARQLSFFGTWAGVLGLLLTDKVSTPRKEGLS